DYEVLLEDICEDTECLDGQEVANKLYDSGTESMQDEIDSGTFATALEQAATSLGKTLEINVESPVFEESIIAVLALASIWYPTWENGKYCENDGGQPTYMRLNPQSWLHNSRDSCCSRYYSYDYAVCMGIGARAIGYYPAWDGSSKCRNDDEVPNFMRLNSKQWIYGDIEACCKRYYKYDW
ncbi:hypothetical protein ACHAWF_015925, partial [Thalassiosira exigua]